MKTRNVQPKTANKGWPRFGLAGLAVAMAVVTFLLPANTSSTEAHPLGNFSVNHLSIIQVADTGEVSLHYIVDMAELPTFQARDQIDPNGDGVLSDAEASAYVAETGPRLIRNLALEIDGERVAFDIGASEMALLEGQGGLNTMRLELDLTGTLPDGWQNGASATYTDRNFEGTNGWRQVIVVPGSGIGLLETSAPAEDVTQGLTSYPQDLLKSAPAVTSASFRFQAGETTTTVTTSTDANGSTVSRDKANKTLGRFASLVETENLTPAFIVLALLLSAAWGAMHALGPGHGKTVVAAYLVGERGTGRHALYLGLIVTATHTISVFALGAVAVFASGLIATDDIYFWLSLGSGMLVAVLGAGLLYGRLMHLIRGRQTIEVHAHPDHDEVHHHDHDSHEHSHDHAHGHEHAHDEVEHHGHSHVPTQPGWRGIVALGIAGGIVPCPTALVVMLGAIALDRAVFGLVLVTAFSVGLAGVLVSIGLLMVYGKRMLSGRKLPFVSTGLLQRAQLIAPVLSAVAILGVGLVLTGQAVL